MPSCFDNWYVVKTITPYENMVTHLIPSPTKSYFEETVFLANALCFLYRDKVLACAKHFVGDGGTIRGINENNTVIDRHGLLSIHMPPFLDSVIKGVGTIMTSYSSLNGVKMHANHELVTNFLKGTLKFRVQTFSYTIYTKFFLVI